MKNPANTPNSSTPKKGFFSRIFKKGEDRQHEEGLHLEALEARILYSAAPVEVSGDTGADAAVADHVAPASPAPAATPAPAPAPVPAAEASPETSTPSGAVAAPAPEAQLPEFADQQASDAAGFDIEIGDQVASEGAVIEFADGALPAQAEGGVVEIEMVGSDFALTDATGEMAFGDIAGAYLEVDQQLGLDQEVALPEMLTAADLSPIIQESIDRWVDSGLSAEQFEALQNVTYAIGDLGGNVLGATEGFVIAIDDDAAGRTWFVDTTPTQDEEFMVTDLSTRLEAQETNVARQVDLLSVVMHEQGHILGLLDSGSGPADLMDGRFGVGERRLAEDGQADGAIAGSLEGIHYAVISHTTNGAVTVTENTVGGVSYVQVVDSLVFGAGTGADITLNTTDDSDITLAGIEFATDTYDLEDSAAGEKLIIVDGGQISMLEDGNNDPIDINADIIFGTAATGQTGLIINEDNNDLLNFTRDVNIQGNALTITSGQGFTQLSDGAAFDTSDSDEDIRFTASSTITGTADSTINVRGDANVRLFADNTATFAGNWTLNGNQGTPRVFVITNGALGTGTVLLGHTGAEVRVSNGVDVSNTFTFSNTGNDKTLRWDGLGSQTHSGDIFTEETASNRANLHVQNAANTVTVTGLVQSATNNAWFEKTGGGTLVLTNTGNSAELDRFRISDGTAIFATEGSQANNQLLLSGDGRLFIGDGVTMASGTTTFITSNANAKVLGLQDGATSATWAGEIRHEVDASQTNGAFELFAASGGTFTISGDIVDNNGDEAIADLRKTGLGMVELTSAANTYGDLGTTTGGNTVVAEGTLRVIDGANNLAATTTLVVDANAFFGGSGDISTFVGTGAGAASFAANSGILVDVDNSGPQLTIGATPVDVTNLNLALNVLTVPVDNNPITILNNVQAGTFFANASEGSTQIIDGNEYTVTYNGTDVQLALVAAVTAETDVRVVDGNLIIEDINGGTTNDNLSFAISGSNYVISSTDPANVLQATSGTLANANTVTVPVSSVTGAVQFLSGGGTDTLNITSNLTLPGALEIQTANVTVPDFWTVDTSATNSDVTIGGTLTAAGNQDVAFNAGSGNVTISGNGNELSNLRVIRSTGTGNVTIDSDLDSTSGMFFDGVADTATPPTFIINGEITGSGVIELRNDALMTVTSDNSAAGDQAAQTGNWNVNSGVGNPILTITNENALGTGNLLTLNNSGARLIVDTDGTISTNITMNNTGTDKTLEVFNNHVVEFTGTLALNETSSNGTRNRFEIEDGATVTISGVLDADSSGFLVQGGNSESRLIIGNAGNLIAGRITLNDPGRTVFRDASGIAATTDIYINDTNASLELGDGVNLAVENVFYTNNQNQKFIRMESGATAATLSVSNGITIQETAAGNPRIDAVTGQTLTVNADVNGTGGGGLRKVGDGTVILDGTTNAFTGILDIDAGTVFLNGALTAATVDLAAGTRLGGTGSVTNAITSTGGTLRAGDGTTTGTLTTAGAVTLDAASTVEVLITDASTFDQIIANGAVDLDGATLNITVDPAFTPAADGSETFVIVDNAAALVGGNQFSQGTTNFFSNGYEYSVSYAGGGDSFDVVLTLVGIEAVELEANIDGSGNFTINDVATDQADTLTVTEGVNGSSEAVYIIETNNRIDAAAGSVAGITVISPTRIEVLKTAVIGNFIIQTNFDPGENTGTGSSDVVNLNIDPNAGGNLLGNVEITADTINLGSSVSAVGDITLTGNKILQTAVTLSAVDVFLLDGNSVATVAGTAAVGQTNLNGNQLTIDVTGTAGNQTGRLIGAGGFVKAGIGSWDLMPYADRTNFANNSTTNNMRNSFSGGVQVNAGALTLELGSTQRSRGILTTQDVVIADGATMTIDRVNSVGDVVRIEVQEGGILNINSSDLIGNITGAGTVNLGNTLQLRNETVGASFDGVLTGSGSLQIRGQQTAEDPFTLNQADGSTYTGTIVVGSNTGNTGGVGENVNHALHIDGQTDAGNVSVRSQREGNGTFEIYSATFGGTGILDSPINAQVLTNILPGQDAVRTTGTGTLTVNGDVNLGQASSDGQVTRLLGQVETATVVSAGGVTTDGTLNVTVTGAAITGSPLLVPVALTSATHTSAALVATAIRAELVTAIGTTVYTPTGTGADVALFQVTANNTNDDTLNIAWESDGTLAGVDPVTTSVNSARGDDLLIADDPRYNNGTQPAGLVGTNAATRLVIRVDGAGGTTDQLVVNGSLDISLPTELILQNTDGSPFSGTLTESVYTIATSTGGVSGTFVESFNLPAGYEVNFDETGEIRLVTVAPEILTLNPADEGTDVEANSNLAVEFNQNIQAGTGNITITGGAGGPVVIPIAGDANGAVTIAGSTLTINPAVNLDLGTVYNIQIDAGAVTDLDGTPNDFAGISDGTTWNFTINASPPPETSVSLVDGVLTIFDAEADNADALTITDDGANFVITDAVLTVGSDGSVVDSDGSVNSVTVSKAGITSIVINTVNAGTDANNDAVTISNDLNFAGPITVTAEAINLGANLTSTVGDITLNGDVTITAPTVALTASEAGAGDVFINGTTDLGGNALTVSAAGTGTATGVISGAGSLTKDGAGDFVLSAVNDYTGGTTVTSGILRIGDGTTGSIVGDVVTNATLNFNQGSALTYDGTISGTGNLSKAGGGNVTLTAANSYEGTTSVNAGILTITDAGGLGDGEVIINFTNSRLRIDVDATGVNAIANDITISTGGNAKVLEIMDGHTVELTGLVKLDENTSLGSRNQLHVQNGSTLIISGTLDANRGGANAGFQVQSGDADSKVIITNGNGNNTVAGRINIDTGSLIIRDSNALGTAFVQLNNSETAFVLGDGVTAANDVTMTNRNNTKYIQMEDGAMTAALSGTVTLSGNANGENRVDLDAGQTLTFTGTVTGAANDLRVIGSGTTIFDAAATTDFTGGLDVDGGTVIVNSALAASTVNLAADTLLGGTGTVNGVITSVGGTVRPGGFASTGILNTTAAVTLDGTSAMSFRLGGTTAGTHDQLTATGAVTLDGANLNIVTQPGFTPIADGSETFVLIDNASAVVTGEFAQGTTEFVSNGFRYTVDYAAGGDGFDVVVTLESKVVTLYVDDSFTGSTGDAVADGDTEATGNQGATLGTDAFTTIGAAIAQLNIDGVANDAIIIVNSGTYTEAVDLTAFGPNIELQFVGGDSTVTSIAGTATDTIQLGGFDPSHTTAVNLTLGDNSDQETASVLSGTGGITKVGTGTLTLSGDNTHSGTNTVSAGVLKLGSTTALGNLGPVAAGTATVSETVVESGAALDLNGVFSTFAGGEVIDELITISGDGIAGDASNGAIFNSGAGLVNRGLGVVALAGNASVGTDAGRFDIRGQLIGNGFTYTKVGTDFTGVQAQTNVAAIVIDAGDFGLVSNLNGVNGTVTVNTGGRLATFNGKNFAGDIILNGGSIRSTSQNDTTDRDITIGGTITLGALGGTLETVNAAAPNVVTQIVNAVISGSGTLTKAGTGTVTLQGANTYAGATTVSAGIVVLGNTTALGTTAGATTVADGATLDLNGQTIAEDLTITGTGVGTNGALMNSDGANEAFNTGVVTNQGFTLGGAGDIDLAGVNGNTLTKIDAGTLTLSGTGDNNSLTLDAQVGTVLLEKTSSGSVHAVFNISNISAGATVQITGTGGDQIFNSRDISGVNGTFDLNGQSEGVRSINTGATGVIDNTAATNATLTFGLNNGGGTQSGTIQNSGSGTLALFKTGTGAARLLGTANTFSGGLTIDGGFVMAEVDGSLGDTSGTLTLQNGGTLQNDNSNVILDANRQIILGGGEGRLRAGWSNRTITVNGQITGSGDLRIVNDSSTVVLANGTNNYTGDTILGGDGTNSGTGITGRARLGAADAIPNGATAGDVIFDGGTGATFTLDLNGFSDTINGISTNSGSAVVETGTGTATLTIGDNNSTSSFGGLIQNGAGTLSIGKVGTGTLTLTNANTYTGLTSVQGGTLQLQTGAFSTTARNYEIAASATLNLDGNTGVASGTTDFSGAGTLLVTGGTFGNEAPNSPRGNGRNITMSLDSGALIDVDSGATMINGGWQNTTWTSNLADFNVDGTFDVWDGKDVSVDALTGSGTITANQGSGGVFTVGVDSGDGDFTGVIQDGARALSVAKAGTGTQTLSGDSTYTGTTGVSAGTLLVNGNNSAATGAVSVSSGANLGGTGTVGGIVTALAGSSVAPGVSGVGTLTIAANVNLAGDLEFDISGATSDLLDVDGDVAAGDDVTLSGALNITGTGTEALYTVIDNDGTADAVSGVFSNLNVDGATIDIGGVTYKIFYGGGDGNNVVLANATAPDTVYVDDAWTTGLNGGQTIADADLGTNLDQGAVFGINAFATVADAIAAAADNATIIVNSGSYTETASLADGKKLKITGPDTPGAVTITDLSTAVGTEIIIEGASLTVNNAAAQAIAGTISGSGNFANGGAGTLTISGNNSYTGTTTLNDGTTRITHSSAFGGVGGGQVSLNQTTLELGAGLTVANDFFVRNSGDLKTIRFDEPGMTTTTLSGNFTHHENTAGRFVIFAGADDTLTLSGVLSTTHATAGTGGITKSGSGTVVLTGISDYRGDTRVTAGTFTVDGQITGNGTVTISSGATLSGGGTVNTKIAATTVGANIVATGDLTLGDATSTSGFAFTGTLNVGSHTVTLNDSNAASIGRSTVLGLGATNGALTAANGLSMSANDVLSGIGTVTGDLDTNSGSISAGDDGGDRTGTLSIVGNLEVGAGGTLIAHVDGLTAGDFDQLVVTGGVTLNATSNLNVTGTTVTVGSVTLVANDNNDAVTGAGVFSNFAEGDTVTINTDKDFEITYVGGTDSNDVVLDTPQETTVTVDAGGNLVITDVLNDSADTITITNDATNIIITDTAGLSRTVPRASVTGGLVVQSAFGGNEATDSNNDVVNINTTHVFAGPITITADSVVQGAAGVLDTTSGDVTINADGAVNLAGTVGTAANLAISSGAGDITIADGEIDGTVALTTTTGNATITNATAIDLATGSVGGNLDITATTGNVTDSGALTIGGTTDITTSQTDADIILDTLAATGAIALNTTGTGGNATVTNATAVDLATSNVGGNLDVTATTGNVTDSGTATVGGTTDVTTSANGADITLDDLAATGTIAVNTTGVGGDATVTNATAVDLAASNVGGNLDVTATTGNVTDSGTVTVGGTTEATTSQTDADIVLDTLASTGAIAVNTTGSGGDATVTNATAVDLAASNVGGDLDVTATTGDITDSGTATVGGTADFTTSAADDDINLDALAVTGQIGVTTNGTGGDATLVNATAIDLNPASAVGNDLSATATTGDVTATALTLNGDATLSGEDVILGTVNTGTGGNTLTVNATGTDSASSGAISGDGNVVLNGPGTFAANGTNTNTGTTTVNGGTLAGTGTVTNLTVGAGATVDPGAPGAVGTLSVTGDATINGTLEVDVNGSASDVLAVTGTATLSGPLALDFATPATDGDAITPVTSGAPITTTLAGLAEGDTIPLGALEGTVSYLGNNLGIAIAPPATPPTGGGGGETGTPTTEEPVVEVTAETPTGTVVGAQAVAEALAPAEFVAEAAAALDSFGTFFTDQFVRDLGVPNESNNPFRIGSGLPELIIERIEPEFAENGAQLNGLNLYIQSSDPDAPASFIFAALDPVTEAYSFQTSDLMTILEAYHALLRPVGFGTDIFENVFGSPGRLDEDENNLVPEEQSTNVAEGGENLLSSTQETESQFELTGLLNAVRSLEEPSIFAGLESGAESDSPTPVLAGVGIAETELAILIKDSSGKPQTTQVVKVGPEGHWTARLQGIELSAATQVEIVAADEARTYNINVTALIDALASAEDVGSVMGQIIEATAVS